MKIYLALIGRNKEQWIKNGLNEYLKRIQKYVPFKVVEIPGIKGAGKLSEQEIMEKEGKEILKNLKENSYVVLLDEKGKHYSSLEFAKWIQGIMNRSVQNVFFVIGGAYGFSDEVKKRADSKISLSHMTFSHQLVRIIFAEQFYRALTIIKGEPYHHGS
jgi:23S rRNA (pseudouridine1915-N3)-methyltransferase